MYRLDGKYKPPSRSSSHQSHELPCFPASLLLTLPADLFLSADTFITNHKYAVLPNVPLVQMGKKKKTYQLKSCKVPG